MIQKAAVRAFLNRPLHDSAKAKRFTTEALDEKLARLFPRPRFHTPPWDNQKVGFLLGLKYHQYEFLFDMGLGKSKVCLDLFTYLERCGEVNRALVMVPFTVNVGAWLEECETHAPRLHAAGVFGEKDERVGVVEGEAQVVIITFMGWLNLVCKREASKKDESKRRMVIDETKARRLESMFDFVVWDESSFMGNHQSLTYKACRRLAKTCEYRYGLTGTPFGRDPQMFWSQMYLIDHGETLGPTLGIFREVYFTKKQSYWGRGFEYTFDPKKEEALNRAFRNRSIRYSEDECHDLPKKVYTTHRVIFPEETWAYYDKLVKELQAVQGNFRLMENAFVRMRQLCSGFLAVRDPEGERIEVVFKSNPKLDDLIDSVLGIPAERKAVVFCEFVASGGIISAALKEAKVKHVRLYGATKHKEEVVDRFKRDEGCQVLVSSMAGAYGLNLQVANYCFVYESPVSPIVRAQMEKRLHRRGQTRTVFYRDFVVKGSVEEKILRYISEGKDLFQSLVEEGTDEL